MKELNNWSSESVQKKPIIEFSIGYQQFCDPEGNVVSELPAFAKDTAYLINLYTRMVETRVFDSKAIALQRTGKMGTYASVLGQEAIGTGIAAAMRVEDVLCPYYREVGAQLARGVAMEEILLYWGGDERGSAYQNPNVKDDFPICVPIASQTLHAVGVALAFKLKKEPRVVVTVVGDGGTSRGDFYEAMNLTGVMQLPVVFVVNNNQWAISVAREHQTAAATFAQKGIAAGIPSEQIDGNDVIAVCHNVGVALEKARSGGGPSLIEAITYRLCDHTTADDARRYRDAVELEKHKMKDPILRLSNYLTQQKVWDEKQEQHVQKQAQEKVAAAVQRYQDTPSRRPESMFDHLYKTLPQAYFAQREAAEAFTGEKSHG